jgi:hypothetical protein
MIGPAKGAKSDEILRLLAEGWQLYFCEYDYWVLESPDGASTPLGRFRVADGRSVRALIQRGKVDEEGGMRG